MLLSSLDWQFGLTSPITCRRPAVSVQFKQNRKRAAVKWNGLLASIALSGRPLFALLPFLHYRS
jgi:hypothetical protein